MREENPDKYLELAYASMKRHVELMIELQARGAITFDYGNNLRARAKEAGLENAFDYPGLFQLIYVHYFVKAKDHFAGLH
jgi:urocanate hydratase